MKNKKALTAYMIVLLISSLVVTSLFLLIFDSIYKKENQLCQNTKFDIENICVSGSSLSFKVSNRAPEILEFLLNGANDQTLSVGESKTYNIPNDGSKSITITPVINIGSETSFCYSKNFVIDSKTITKIC